MELCSIPESSQRRHCCEDVEFSIKISDVFDLADQYD